MINIDTFPRDYYSFEDTFFVISEISSLMQTIFTSCMYTYSSIFGKFLFLSYPTGSVSASWKRLKMMTSQIDMYDEKVFIYPEQIRLKTFTIINLIKITDEKLIASSTSKSVYILYIDLFYILSLFLTQLFCDYSIYINM